MSSPDPEEKHISGDEEEEDEEKDVVGELGVQKSVRPPTPPLHGRSLIKLMKYLYIGDQSVIAKKELLVQQRIKKIITLTEDEEFEDDFEYFSYSLPNNGDIRITKHFDEWYKIISECRDKDIKVLVQDDCAQSQAVAVVLSYMIRSAAEKGKRLTLNAAVKYMMSKQPRMQVHDGFLRQLIKFEKELLGEASLRVRGSGGRGGGRGGRGKGRRKR